MPGNGLSGWRWENARQQVFRNQTVCNICGEPVDQNLKFPHPMSRSVDHIIPLSRGGDPYALSNLALTHLAHNRAKWDGVRQNNPTSRRWLKA